MSWDEFHHLVDSGVRTAIVPTGSIEQHGYHLPLATDGIAAETVAEALAIRLGAILAPLVPYGNSSNHMKYSGTVSLAHDTLRVLIRDICVSLTKHGIKRIVILNGHGNNTPALEAAAREVKDETGAIITISSYYYALGEDYQKFVKSAISFREFWAHGGVMETAVVISAAPKSVNLSKASVGSSERVQLFEDSAVSYPTDAEELSPSGSYGNPRPANARMGEQIVEHVADILARKLTKVWKELEKMGKSKVSLPRKVRR